MSLIPPAVVKTSLSANSKALSILLNPPWHCKELTSLLTSVLLRRLPERVLNLRTTLASELKVTRAMRPPEGDTLKKFTKVCTKYSRRFQLLLLSQTLESIIKVVSIGIGQDSVEKKSIEFPLFIVPLSPNPTHKLY